MLIEYLGGSWKIEGKMLIEYLGGSWSDWR